jgi:hypothetical protein
MYVTENSVVNVTVPVSSVTGIDSYHVEVTKPNGSKVLVHPTEWVTAVSTTAKGIYNTPIIDFDVDGAYTLTSYRASSEDLDTGNVVLTNIGMTTVIKVTAATPTIG